MARGKKTPPEVIYKVMSSWATTDNYEETARELDMPATTVEKIVKTNKDKKEFVELCDQKRKTFADKADEIINKGLMIINKRLTMALEKQYELDLLIDAIDDTDEEEMSYKEKIAIINLIKETQLQKIKDITTAIGTLYDKRALARGESTGNITISANADISKLAEIAGYVKKEDADNE